MAVAYGRTEIVRLLLNTPNRGIDPTAQDNWSIYMAGYMGYPEIVRLLMDQGIDPTGAGNILIKNATRKGHIAVIKLLFDSIPI